MNSILLYRDEMRGFFRSKVIIVLAVGLPLLVFLLRLVRPDTEGMPFFAFTAILIASIGGTLGAVLLSTALTSERGRHVYDLFLIRPVRRSELILSKYFAALTALLLTAILALLVGFGADVIAGRPAIDIVVDGLQPVVLSLAGMAIACSAGVLLGVLLDSVAGSAILAVYLGNQLSAFAVLPSALAPQLPVIPIAAAVGIAVPVAVLTVAVAVFRRKTV